MKYELTDRYINYKDYKLYQIRALKDFGDVKVGDLGGFVEKYYNLSHQDNCWIYDNATVYESARIYDNARVDSNTHVFGQAKVYDNAKVSGYASVSGNAQIFGAATVYGNAEIFDFAHVHGSATVKGNALVHENAEVYGDASILRDAHISGKAKLLGDVIVNGPLHIYGETVLCEGIITEQDDFITFVIHPFCVTATASGIVLTEKFFPYPPNISTEGKFSIKNGKVNIGKLGGAFITAAQEYFKKKSNGVQYYQIKEL